MIVQKADSPLVSGLILAHVWFGKQVPPVQYENADLVDEITIGERVEVNADTGAITIA